MPTFTKAHVIINDDLLEREMQLCGYSLDDVLSVINEPDPKGENNMHFKYFRRKCGRQKIRVSYTIRKSMQGEEYAIVNEVIPDIPPKE